MAFKGCFQKDRHQNKNLINDHCLSQFNLNESTWPDEDIIKGGAFDELERLNKDVELKGINLVLEWSCESDLDLHAMCGCGTWTETPYYIQCDDCHMKRDVDTRTGKANRKATEHITFNNSEEMIGKEIGVTVQNHLPSGGDDTVTEAEFTLYAINRYEVVIWPKEKVKKVEREDWMKVGMENGDWSDMKIFKYTQAMHDMGIIKFEARLTQIASAQKDGQGCEWDINAVLAAEANQDQDYLDYKNSW